MNKEELIKELTSDFATITESLTAILETIFEKGYVDGFTLENMLDEEIEGIPCTVIFQRQDGF